MIRWMNLQRAWVEDVGGGLRHEVLETDAVNRVGDEHFPGDPPELIAPIAVIVEVGQSLETARREQQPDRRGDEGARGDADDRPPASAHHHQGGEENDDRRDRPTAGLGPRQGQPADDDRAEQQQPRSRPPDRRQQAAGQDRGGEDSGGEDIGVPCSPLHPALPGQRVVGSAAEPQEAAERGQHGAGDERRHDQAHVLLRVHRQHQRREYAEADPVLPELAQGALRGGRPQHSRGEPGEEDGGDEQEGSCQPRPRPNRRRVPETDSQEGGGRRDQADFEKHVSDREEGDEERDGPGGEHRHEAEQRQARVARHHEQAETDPGVDRDDRPEAGSQPQGERDDDCRARLKTSPPKRRGRWRIGYGAAHLAVQSGVGVMAGRL